MTLGMRTACVVQISVSGRYPSSFFHLEHSVSETGFCLRLQVVPTQLGPVDRASPYFQICVFWIKTEWWVMSRNTVIALICHHHKVLDFVYWLPVYLPCCFINAHCHWNLCNYSHFCCRLWKGTPDSEHSFLPTPWGLRQVKGTSFCFHTHFIPYFFFIIIFILVCRVFY
jgi:hypothetical protein